MDVVFFLSKKISFFKYILKLIKRLKKGDKIYGI